MTLPIGSGNFLGMTSMDTIFAQQATTKVDLIEKPCVLEYLRPSLMRSSIMEALKKYMNSIFMVPNLLLQWYSNVIGLTLKWQNRHSNLGLVEIQQDSTIPGDDIYIVAQQATQVYYLPYACQTKEHLKDWDVVYKVSPHGKLHVPNIEDYNLDPDTYDRVFFQEDVLEGQFELDLTEAIKMEVDIEMAVDEEEDEVQNENNLEILEGNDINDELAPSDGIDYEMVDSNDETYGLANSNTYNVYF
jgi:hypothetical protein